MKKQIITQHIKIKMNYKYIKTINTQLKKVLNICNSNNKFTNNQKKKSKEKIV